MTATIHYLPVKRRPTGKMTPTQIMMLADLSDAPLTGLFPTEAGEVRTARSLVERGYADWQGQFLHITDAGKAYMADPKR